MANQPAHFKIILESMIILWQTDKPLPVLRKRVILRRPASPGDFLCTQ
jgi:hypothetical protein